ncbi:MAG: hypothetical protein JWR35_2405 [Marmoricola sp.]|jgi:hypothetical protein|nr:hypothetical protein [Marmoricola sp.]
MNRRGIAFSAVLVVLTSVTACSSDVESSDQGATHTTRTTHAKTTPVAHDVVPKPVPTLPNGGYRVFDHNFLVAYYGTAGTGSLGVLGEAGPDQIMPRLLRAAKPFARPGRPTQPVFELIVSVAQASAGAGGDYSNDIDRSAVQRYIDAAHRHRVLLVLDLQTGRSDFLTVAKRWAWALKDPWVGLALDPEWRMGPHQVPAHVIGSVSASEVNRTSAWLNQLTATNRLPQKVFMLHQFTPSMIRNIGKISRRTHLVLVQHIDGYGPPKAKLATYNRVSRPHRFRMGFKLFYDEDKPRMTPAQVLRELPRVRFVSFQ